MQKKIMSFMFITTCLINASHIAAQDHHDKYTEWCQNLDLTHEQAERLFSYLDDLKKIVTHEKLKEYNNAKQEGIAPQDKFNEDTDAQIFALRTKQMGEDPVLCKALLQIGCLIGLDLTYSVDNKELTQIDHKAVADQTLDLEKTVKYFELFEKSIESCKACNKFHNRTRK